jgi:uncharacterized OB-fold protein
MGHKRCPNCGKRVPQEELSCPRCGHSIPLISAEDGGGMPLTAGSWDADEESDFADDDEGDLPVAECPACGRQVRPGWDACLWCGASLPQYLWRRAEPVVDGGGNGHPREDDDADEHKDADADRPSPLPVDEDIVDDLYLLEQATDEARRLPLRLPFTSPLDEDESGEKKAGDREKKAGDREKKSGGPRPSGWECPVCGRQVRPGWTNCPWCQAPLAYAREGEDAAD